MKRTILYIIAFLGCVIASHQAVAQDYALKAYGDIGLGKAISLTTALPGLSSKSSSNAFGVDFGYTFWRMGRNSLEANIGLGYRLASATFELGNMSYSYAAPAYADKDANTYVRHITLTDVKQKIDLGYLNIPLYLQYQYRATKWLGVHADVGFGFGFKCKASVGTTSGIVYSYGVYPQYKNLVIKAPYINDFGNVDLDRADSDKVEAQGFAASVMCGAALEFYVYDPVSIDVGVRYNCGLTQSFKGKYDVMSATDISVESAPVTYTVADGTRLKPLCDYNTKNRLNPISLHIGVNIRF